MNITREEFVEVLRGEARWRSMGGSGGVMDDVNYGVASALESIADDLERRGRETS